YPFLWTDLVGTVVWFLTAGIAVSCGVGGGGIYMPLGMILLRFAPKQSTGLSQACIFGAGLGGLIINSRKRHPDRHIRDTKGFYTRPIIDYDLALFQAPMELAGAVVGVTVQRLLPDWLFLSIAVVILGLTCFKTFQKFFESYKKDKMQKKHLAFLAQRHLDEQEAQKIPGCPSPGYNSDESEHTTVELCAESVPDDVMILRCLWRLFLRIFRTSHQALTSMMTQWNLNFVDSSLQRMLTSFRGLRLLHCLYFGLWDYKQVRDFSLVSFGAGMIGGLVGISAGYFTGPFMIQRGLHPRVSTATTATTMLLTSSSVAVMFVLSGLLPWEYALYFFLVCVTGAFVGKTRIDAYVKKTGMASVLIGALATIIGCSTLGCLVILLTNLAG
ncbi:predicted protein, partial [Thalassiosira pseudonana CCMP1335]